MINRRFLLLLSGAFCVMVLSLTTFIGCDRPAPDSSGVDSADSGWSVQQFYAVPEGTVYNSISCINRGTDSATCRALGNFRSWTKTNFDSLYSYFLVNPENGNSTQISLRGDATMRNNIPANSLKWLNANTGWLTRAGYLFKSTDGGASWDWQQTVCPLSAGALAFLDGGNLGWAVGDVGLFSRLSEGSKWICQDISNLREQPMHAVLFVDSSFGWAVGEMGNVLHTETGGVAWIPQYSSTPEVLRSVFFSNRRSGWAVGAHGTIIHTSDGGENWALQSSQTVQPLYSIAFVDSTEGWAVGANGAIVHTRDAGVHWYRQSSGTHRNLFGIDFVDKNLVYVVGDGSTLLKFKR